MNTTKQAIPIDNLNQSLSNFVTILWDLLGLIDSSGINLQFVKHLRKFDVGIMELGLEYTDKMAIPPGLVAFPLTGFCTPECTDIVGTRKCYVVPP